MTLQTTYYIDNFSLQVPHPQFLSSANRYLKQRYGADVQVSQEALHQWVLLFKAKQKQILSLWAARER